MLASQMAQLVAILIPKLRPRIELSQLSYASLRNLNSGHYAVLAT